MRRARDAGLLLVPQVDAGLVADLRRGGQAGEDRLPGPDDRVLGVPGQAGAVEVRQVIVEDARLGRLAGDHVPDRLIQASGDQVPAGQVHCGGPGQHLGQRARAVQGRLEGGHLLVDGKPSGIHVTSLECEAASRRRVLPGTTGWARLQCPAEPAETAWLAGRRPR